MVGIGESINGRRRPGTYETFFHVLPDLYKIGIFHIFPYMIGFVHLFHGSELASKLTLREHGQQFGANTFGSGNPMYSGTP